MRQMIKNRQYDEERALYHLKNTDVLNCVFAGEADGESVLKEARDVNLKDCSLSPMACEEIFHGICDDG